MLIDTLYVVIFGLVTVIAFLFAVLRTTQISRDGWLDHVNLVVKQRDSLFEMLKRDSGLMYRWTRPKSTLSWNEIKREISARRSVLVEFIDELEFK